jgi:hypothetical protein
MAQGKDYALRGGAAGRERLRILSRVMHASTTSLFDRVGINEGQLCLDVGCGSGDVTWSLPDELARAARPSARTSCDATRHRPPRSGCVGNSQRGVPIVRHPSRGRRHWLRLRRSLCQVPAHAPRQPIPRYRRVLPLFVARRARHSRRRRLRWVFHLSRIQSVSAIQGTLLQSGPETGRRSEHRATLADLAFRSACKSRTRDGPRPTRDLKPLSV